MSNATSKEQKRYRRRRIIYHIVANILPWTIIVIGAITLIIASIALLSWEQVKAAIQENTMTPSQMHVPVEPMQDTKPLCPLNPIPEEEVFPEVFKPQLDYDNLYLPAPGKQLTDEEILRATENFKALTGAEYSRKEQELLLRIAMAEAEGEGVIGKMHVIHVVINRVHSNDFPDTIEEVIYEPKQFSPVGTSRWELEPDAGCHEALERILLEGWNETQGATYFDAVWLGESTWHTRNLEHLFTYKNHRFYK